MNDISRSRAMAVADHGGRIYVYALKSMDEMRAEFREKSWLEPIKEVSIGLALSEHTSPLMIVSL